MGLERHVVADQALQMTQAEEGQEETVKKEGWLAKASHRFDLQLPR